MITITNDITKLNGSDILIDITNNAANKALVSPYQPKNNTDAQINFCCDMYNAFIFDLFDQFENELDEKELAAYKYLNQIVDMYNRDKDPTIVILYEEPFINMAYTISNVLKQLIDRSKEPAEKEMKVLYCNNDKRFSDNGAQVEIFGKTSTIEDIYNNSRRTKNKELATTDEETSYFVLNIPRNGSYETVSFGNYYLHAFYTMLWIKYLDKNPDVVEYAKQFDEFNGNAADIIEAYVNGKRQHLISSIKELNNLIKKAVANKPEPAQVVSTNNQSVSEIKQPIDYAKRNNKVYNGCVGRYSMLPVTDDQIELIQKLVSTYKVKIHYCSTRGDATKTIHRVYDLIHKKQLRLRTNHEGHVELIDDEYVFVS